MVRLVEEIPGRFGGRTISDSDCVRIMACPESRTVVLEARDGKVITAQAAIIVWHPEDAAAVFGVNTCPVCKRTFETAAALATHVSMVHGNGKDKAR